VHRGDPVAVLNLEPVLEKLHRDIEDPDYLKRLLRELLLDNPHRVRLVMNPDTQLAARRRTAEEQQLAAIRATLDEEASARIVETATTLAERQNQRPTTPACHASPSRTCAGTAGHRVVAGGGVSQPQRTRGTNGIVYQQVIVDLPALTPEQQELLPCYGNFLSELGSGGRDALQTQALQPR
jgi:hypothetical protein